MIFENTTLCPKCGGSLKYYDVVKRKVLTQNRQSVFIKIERYKCKSCGSVHRKLPNCIIPYKQYSRLIIMGVLNETITSDILEFEDFPCEMTMKRWITNLNK